MSLRTRITLAAASAVAAVALLLGAISYFTTRAQQLSQVRQELGQRVRPPDGHGGGDEGPGHPGARGGGQVCQSSAGSSAPAPPLGGAPGYIQAVCANGRVVADQGGTPLLPVTPAVRALARKTKGSSFYFSTYVRGTHVEILATGDPPDHKAIEIALPLTSVDSALHKMLLTYVLLGAVAVLLAALAGRLIARAALSPIRRLSAETEQVTASLDQARRLQPQGAQELRALAASFNQTLDALERSVQAQRSLIADASHELRTPMAALRSNIEVFLRSERLPFEDRQGLQQAIIDELDELTQLVSDVLELARGSTPSERTESVELDVIVREAVERTRRRATHLTFELDLDPTVIVNSPERVSRAVLNVIDNARKWSPEGAAVEVSLHDGVLTVRDHGPGFDENDLGHVFDRFYRSAQARRMTGSGLGLAIVKQAAETHGGFAEATNAPDGGAVLRVSFGPGTPNHAPAEVAAAASAHP